MKAKFRKWFEGAFLSAYYSTVKIRGTKVLLDEEQVEAQISGDVSEVAAFLFSTTKGIYRFQDGQVLRIHKGPTFGIATDGSRIFFTQTRKILGKLSHDRLYVREASFGPSELRYAPLESHVHQICLDSSGAKLFITETYTNCILGINLATNEAHKYYPLGRVASRQSENYAHFNSIVDCGSQICILAHNETKKTGRRSELVICDADMNLIDRIETPSACGHNLVFSNGSLYTCDSLGTDFQGGGMMRFDLSSRNWDLVHPMRNVLSRGIAINESAILVGGSELLERSQRTGGTGTISVLDNEDHRQRGMIKLPNIGAIRDIRFLNNQYEQVNAVTASLIS